MLQKKLFEQPGAFQYFFEDHPDGIGVVDADGHFVYVNASALTMLGYTQNEILQTSLDQLLHSSNGNNSPLAGKIEAPCKLAIQHKNGDLLYVKLTSIPFKRDGQELGSIIRFEAITQQAAQGKKISDIQEMFLFISEKSQNIISSFSADGVFTYISPNVKALLGYTPEEVMGKPAAFFNHPDTNKKLLEHHNSMYIDQNTVRFTGRVRHKNGEYRWYETTAEYIRDPSGEMIQSIGVGRDITDRQEAEEIIAHLAYHDSVTDLPNRRSFKERVSLLLALSKNELHGLMLLDLDGFKNVNDTFGHDSGDLLLIEVAKRLTLAAGDKGFVARWGGDEFTILYKNLENRAAFTSFMERIKNEIAESMVIAGHTVSITASIGASFFPEDGDTIDALIKDADTAMYRDKNGAMMSAKDKN